MRGEPGDDGGRGTGVGGDVGGSPAGEGGARGECVELGGKVSGVGQGCGGEGTSRGVVGNRGRGRGKDAGEGFRVVISRSLAMCGKRYVRVDRCLQDVHIL